MAQPDCLGEDTIAQFLAGALSADTLGRVDAHLVECAECRGVVADCAPPGSLDLPLTEGHTVLESGTASDEMLAPLKPGALVGRYIVGDMIGKGGMGVVYRAHDPTLNRPITLKLLRSDRTARKGAQAQLLREAQAMAQLSHPNVVAVYDVGTYQAQVFVAMELVEGQNMGRWLKAQQQSLPEVLAAFVEAGRGLAAAHAVGIVHRDFKPENVLCGNDGRVRVTDFGLARPFAEAATAEQNPITSAEFSAWDLAMTLTEAGAVKGTPAYMAPEQFLGRSADARTDQFSFCVAIYEALYGHRPFEGVGMEELVKGVLAGKVRQEPAPPGVPSRLPTILLRGLRSNPEDRHPSMNDLLAALRGLSAKKRPRSRVRSVALAASALVAAVALGRVLQPRPAAHSELTPEVVAQPSLPAEPAPAQARPVAPLVEPVAPNVNPPAPHRSTHKLPAHPRPRQPSRAYDDSPMEPSFIKKR